MVSSSVGLQQGFVQHLYALMVCACRATMISGENYDLTATLEIPSTDTDSQLHVERTLSVSCCLSAQLRSFCDFVVSFGMASCWNCLSMLPM